MKFITKNSFWIISALYAAIVIACADLPVFWDMYGQVKTAVHFLDTGFRDLFPNDDSFSDNGHFPLYALYLAALFKLLGYKLWVAHLSVLPFLFGFLWELQKICKRFLNDLQTLVVLLLTIAHPALFTQSIYFSSEIAFVFLSLWMLNALLNERASHISISSICLCLLNLRGIAFVLVLFAYFGFARKKKNAWYLICGFIVFLLWMLVHYKISGWFFQNPGNLGHRSIAAPQMMLKNFLLCFWKLLDLGSVVGFVIIFIAAIKMKKLNSPVMFLLLSALSVFIVCVPVSNPVSNRYFLLSYALLLPAFVNASSMFGKKLIPVVYLIFAIVLIRNNWISYPNKYGNAWDCSLKSVTYFDLRQELDDYVKQNKIDPADVAAGFQLYFNDAYYFMQKAAKEYALLSDTEMNTQLYIADSNICNNYNSAREVYLKKEYTLVRSFKKGQVYIDLYKRKS